MIPRPPIVLATALSLALGAGVAHGQQKKGRNKPPKEQEPAEEVRSAEEANARPARPLGLAQALEVAVRQNPGLDQTRVDVAIAEAGVLAAAGVDDWLLQASASASTSRAAEIANQPVQNTTTDAVNLTTGLARNFGFGGTLGVGLSAGTVRNQGFVGRRDANGVPVFDADGNLVLDDFSSVSYTAGLAVSWDQPLLRGFGREIGRAEQTRVAIRRDAAELRLVVQALAVVRDIVQAYWELAYATEEVKIRRSSLELATEQLRITRAGIGAGSVAPTEALAVEQAIATREEGILIAEINVSDRSLALRRLVGLEVGPGEIDLDANDPPATPERAFDLDQTLARALEHSPQLALLETQSSEAALDIALARDSLRPRLDLSARGGPTGAGAKPSGAAESLGTFENFDASVSLAYQQALGRRAAKGRIDQAEASKRRLELDKDEIRRQVAVATVQAVNLVRTARKRIEVTKKSIDLAEQNLDAEKARFDAGTTTNFDVLQRQNELQQAQLASSRATIDFLSAIALVESLTGELLPRYGIEVTAEETHGARAP